MNESEKKIIGNIDEYGCHITSVVDRKKEDPDFTYTIGINQEEKAPELIVLGLRHELGSWIANEYNRRVKGGEKFLEGEYYNGFLEGFQVSFREVAEEYKKEFMLSCNWLYKGTNYPALQLVYPNISGVWPWAEDADEEFRDLQPSFQEKPEW
ncbi:hypothetical protein GCM10008107_31840 [Psychrosphaera saromensis]|uniref:DUF4262 domain-containing protein n=1 Tax=Psychrosphaera saromensis TaxID=716813 RepID=A0A2S7UWM8_9GAMM|nr:DUF4262 domain-containing protein [Psychrosphaera saromensis]PQJ54148.1 hypothetical protein BTO11_11145 [Psychrosphaera saromensis]GHB80010.1 hypothetical protein GCM10008107_31840 [Psychrosphaera saromensis]GLQ12795.1 hypothetical protein GCM10007917_02500 [Psychrosphaera saromensis]